MTGLNVHTPHGKKLHLGQFPSSSVVFGEKPRSSGRRLTTGPFRAPLHRTMLSALARASRVAGRGLAASARALAVAPVASRSPVVFRGMASAAAEMTVRDAINSAIDEEMERDPMVFIMGG